MRILWLLMVLAIPCFSSPNARVDWPGFRGPNGSGVAAAGGLPVEMGPEKNLVWKTEAPPGHSSPALTESHIFLTAADGDKLLTLCLDRATGKILWRRESPRSRNTKLRAKNSASSPSPVTDGENVYVFFEDFGLLSYGPDGDERWRYPIEPLNTRYGPGASPRRKGSRAKAGIKPVMRNFPAPQLPSTSRSARARSATTESVGVASAGYFRPIYPDLGKLVVVGVREGVNRVSDLTGVCLNSHAHHCPLCYSRLDSSVLPQACVR